MAARDLPPPPIQAKVLDDMGIAATVWASWFRDISAPGSDRSASGYFKFPGGLIIQWGVTASLTSATTTAITFPTPFPTACLQVIPGVYSNSAGSTAATGHYGTGTYTTDSFELYNRTSAANYFNWIAIGH